MGVWILIGIFCDNAYHLFWLPSTTILSHVRSRLPNERWLHITRVWSKRLGVALNRYPSNLMTMVIRLAQKLGAFKILDIPASQLVRTYNFLRKLHGVPQTSSNFISDSGMAKLAIPHLRIKVLGGLEHLSVQFAGANCRRRVDREAMWSSVKRVPFSSE